LNHPRVTDIVPHNGPLFSHEVRLDELDEEFTTWVEQAQEVGDHGTR
jgi:hypothetical protein